MRHLLAALAVLSLVASAHGVRAAVIAVTPSTLASVYKAATTQCGDTLQLAAGDYPAWRFTGRDCGAAPIIIDASAANITGLWYGSNLKGLAIRGGKSTGAGLRFDNAFDWRVEGMALAGAGGTDAGVFVLGGGRWEVTETTFTAFKAAVAVNRSKDFRIVGNYAFRLRNDAWTIGSSQDFEVAWNDVVDTRIVTLEEHPDCGGQLFSRAIYLPTARGEIHHNRCRSYFSQGGFVGNHVAERPEYKVGATVWFRAADGTYATRVLQAAEDTDGDGLVALDDGGFDNISLHDNLMIVGFPNGISVTAVRGLVLENNTVQTYRPAPAGVPRTYVAVIDVRSGVTWTRPRCGNVVRGVDGKPDVVDPPCGGTAAPPPANDNDALVASLRTELAAAEAKIAALGAELAAAQATTATASAERDAARAQVATLQGQLDAAAAEASRLRTALAAIGAAAAEALKPAA